MPDSNLLIRIDENVKYLIKARAEDKAAFDAHVVHDDKVSQDYLKPLWEESQRRAGAAKLAALLYATVSGVIALGVSWFVGGHK